jgi:hypothetical protein
VNGNRRLADQLDRADGNPRHAGIEIGLQGIDVSDLAELTAETAAACGTAPTPGAQQNRPPQPTRPRTKKPTAAMAAAMRA